MRPTAPEPITAADSLTGFTCGKPQLDEWLIKTALRAERDHTARTYVSRDTDVSPPHVVGYYCLSAFSIERTTSGGGFLARNAPTMVPAILLGRLAVDISAQGCGLGVSLLHDAVDNAELVSRRIGSRALVVDAIDNNAAQFYLKYGFRSFPSAPLRLFHRL